MLREVGAVAAVGGPRDDEARLVDHEIRRARFTEEDVIDVGHELTASIRKQDDGFAGVGERCRRTDRSTRLRRLHVRNRRVVARAVGRRSKLEVRLHAERRLEARRTTRRVSERDDDVLSRQDRRPVGKSRHEIGAARRRESAERDLPIEVAVAQKVA